MNTVSTRLTKDEVDRTIKAIDALTKKVTRSRKTARDFLIKNGFITKSGKLTKHYR